MVARHDAMINFLKDTAAVSAMFATGVTIDEKALVPAGTLLTICGLVWWIGRKLQRIDDQLEYITRQADRMEEAVEKVDKLPCVLSGTICPSDEADPRKPLKMK